jgi:uncharacterized phage protein gp47/JayE
MPIVYGLTDHGFVRKPLTVIRDELNAAFRSFFGSSLSLSDRSIFGIIIGIIAERLSLLWELLEVIAASQDPDKAGGALLDALATLTGTFRPGAAPSTVRLLLTGDAAAVVPAGSQATTVSTRAAFQTLGDATLVRAAARDAGTTYTRGALAANGAQSARIYRCIQAGTSGGGPGPSTTDSVIADGSCQWAFVGPGDSVASVDARAVAVGPTVAAAGDISQIATSLLGWRGVQNPEDATLGRLTATDAELRQLREIELANAGSSPFDALRANLLQVSDVTSVVLFVNNTDVTDSDGVPPHSVEALVAGGKDQDIFDELLRSIAVGIGTRGNTSGTVVDSQGTPHTLQFSRAVEIPVFASIRVVTDSAAFPADGINQVRNSEVAHVAALPAGRDAVASKLSARAASIDGVLDVTEVLLYTDVITTPATWIPLHAYVATPGARSAVINNGGRKYICIAGGTSGTSGPAGTGLDFLDGTVHWRYLGNNVTINSRERASLAFANVSVSATSGTP